MSRRNKIITYCFRDLDHYCGVKKIPVPRKSEKPERKSNIVIKSMPFSLHRAMHNRNTIQNTNEFKEIERQKSELESQSEELRQERDNLKKSQGEHQSIRSRQSQKSQKSSGNRNYPNPKKFNQKGNIKLNLMSESSEERHKHETPENRSKVNFHDSEDEYGIKQLGGLTVKEKPPKSRKHPRPWHLSPDDEMENEEDEKEDSNFFSFNRNEKTREDVDQTMDKTLDKTKNNNNPLESTKKLRKKNEEIEKLNLQLDEYEKIIEGLQNEKNNLNKKMEFSKDLVKKTTLKANELDKENRNLLNTNDKLRGAFRQMEEDHSNASLKFWLLGIEMLRLNKDLEDKENILILKQKQEQNLKEVNKELAEKLDQSRVEIQKTYKKQDTQTSHLREELALKAEQLARRDQLLEEAKNEIESYKNEVKGLKNKIEESKLDSDKSMIEKLKEFEIAITELKSHNDELSKELEKEKLENEKMPKRLKTVKVENMKLKKQLVEISKERDDAYERLMEEHSKLRDSLSKERKRAIEHQDEADEAKEMIESLNEEKKELERAVRLQKKEISKLKKTFSKQQRSLSDREEYKKRLEDVLYELETFKQEQQEIEEDNNQRMKEAETLINERRMLHSKLEEYEEEIQRLRIENEDLTQELMAVNEREGPGREKQIIYQVEHRDYTQTSLKHFLMALEIHRLNKIVENISSDNRKLMELLNIENNRGLANSSWSSNSNTFKDTNRDQSLITYNNSPAPGFSSRYQHQNFRGSNQNSDREVGLLRQSKMDLEAKVHDYMKTINDLETKVKQMSERYKESSLSHYPRKQSTVSEEGRIRDLEKKLKVLRIENSKLDEALIGKIKEMESMKHRMSASYRGSEYGDLTGSTDRRFGIH